MTTPRTYSASCHCGAIRFTFTCEEITSGRRCNCSICIRKGAVMSSNYFRPSDVEVEGEERLALYQFGDKNVNHFFCRTCGIFPFSTVASVPPDYQGPARPGDYRVNLGCVHDLDVLSLDIQVINGKAL
ncbi:GFA family protein [Anaeromyxobacter terrae]|uniref:GFA family protein n=1 Tax=Anaeromyxobacter terrae TaxID=2925406 RepID=UPI0024367CD4|nr:GFA family protein [Anaeromyxobacter sp. SG22]